MIKLITCNSRWAEWIETNWHYKKNTLKEQRLTLMRISATWRYQEKAATTLADGEITQKKLDAQGNIWNYYNSIQKWNLARSIDTRCYPIRRKRSWVLKAFSDLRGLKFLRCPNSVLRCDPKCTVKTIKLAVSVMV